MGEEGSCSRPRRTPSVAGEALFRKSIQLQHDCDRGLVRNAIIITALRTRLGTAAAGDHIMRWVTIANVMSLENLDTKNIRPSRFSVASKKLVTLQANHLVYCGAFLDLYVPVLCTPYTTPRRKFCLRVATSILHTNTGSPWD